MPEKRDIAEEASKGASGLVNNKYKSSGMILKAGRRKAAKSETRICMKTPAHTPVQQHKLDTAQSVIGPFC